MSLSQHFDRLAENMAIICSLLATCKAHDVNPRNYLNDIIAKMPYMKDTKTEILLELLPHKWELQHPDSIIINNYCYYKKNTASVCSKWANRCCNCSIWWLLVDGRMLTEA